MKNLESTAFEGQQKWVDRKVESVDQELRAQMQWKNTKTAATVAIKIYSFLIIFKIFY